MVHQLEVRQTAFADFQCEHVLERGHLLEHHVRVQGTQLLPVLAARALERCRDDAEVRALVVGADEELLARLLDVVLVLVGARCDQDRRGFRVLGVDQAHLGRELRLALEDDVVLALGAPAVELEARVGLFVDDDVVLRVAADRVAVGAVRALRLVLDDVDEVVRGMSFVSLPTPTSLPPNLHPYLYLTTNTLPSQMTKETSPHAPLALS